MSATWARMLNHERAAISPAEGHHTWWVQAGGYGTGRWSYKAFMAGVRWTLATQRLWGSLQSRLALEELDKDDSVFAPLFELDRTIRVYCPGCDTDVLFSRADQGCCPNCGYDQLR